MTELPVNETAADFLLLIQCLIKYFSSKAIAESNSQEP